MARQSSESWSGGEALLRPEQSKTAGDGWHCEKSRQRQPHRSWIVCVLLGLFLTANVVFSTVALLYGQVFQAQPERTKYAGLARDVQMTFQSASPYGLGAASEQERSVRWESLDSSAGEISLDRAWAGSVGLPAGEPFFWDRSRGLYLVNAHHSLHCLRKVRRAITLAHHGGAPQLDAYPHLVHCLDHLLQNVLYEADDTPMYTSPHRNISTGEGQARMCRSWDRMDAWARRQTACFAYLNETQGVDAVIERFRYCPKDSPFLGPMRAHFGYGADWWRAKPRDIDTMPRYWEAF